MTRGMPPSNEARIAELERRLEQLLRRGLRTPGSDSIVDTLDYLEQLVTYTQRDPNTLNWTGESSGTSVSLGFTLHEEMRVRLTYQAPIIMQAVGQDGSGFVSLITEMRLNGGLVENQVAQLQAQGANVTATPHAFVDVVRDLAAGDHTVQINYTTAMVGQQGTYGERRRGRLAVQVLGRP